MTQVANNNSVASATASQVFVREDTSRKEVFISNASTAILYLLYGPGVASSTNYSVTLPANTNGVATLVEDKFTGQISGVWASANGYAYVAQVIGS